MHESDNEVDDYEPHPATVSNVLGGEEKDSRGKR